MDWNSEFRITYPLILLYIQNAIPDFVVLIVMTGGLQTGIEPEFVLFFECPEEEMERRLLSRNQVRQM